MRRFTRRRRAALGVACVSKGRRGRNGRSAIWAPTDQLAGLHSKEARPGRSVALPGARGAALEAAEGSYEGSSLGSHGTSETTAQDLIHNICAISRVV